jgi:ATP-dependent Zn protease
MKATRTSKCRISKRLKETAYHEAGHAVIGRVLTLDCGGATIEPDHESAGHAITNDPWACLYAWEQRGKVREPDAVWHARIITLMAGAEAVAVLLGAVSRGDGEDRYQIASMAEELQTPGESWDRIEARLRAMTRMLVRRHRARIERVAKALIARKTLSRAELDKFVGRSVDDVKVNAPFLLAMAKMQKEETE